MDQVEKILEASPNMHSSCAYKYKDCIPPAGIFQT